MGFDENLDADFFIIFCGIEKCVFCKLLLLELKQLIKLNDSNFLFIDGNEESNEKILDDFNVESYPHLIILDKNNDIIYNNSGDKISAQGIMDLIK